MNQVVQMAVYEKYTRTIQKITQDPELFTTFKQMPDYTYMLEHVTEEQGAGYLRAIEDGYIVDNKLWDAVLQNDEVGRPKKFTYTLANKRTISCSPTTLRYLKYALDLAMQMVTEANPQHVVELGGGYGGFCKVFLDVATNYGVPVASYTIVDLPDTLPMTEKYLTTVTRQPCDIQFCTSDSVRDSPIDYFVSHYCFSELSPEVREKYVETLLSRARHGFIAWNLIPVYNFGQKIVVEPEVPLTGKGNCLVTW